MEHALSDECGNHDLRIGFWRGRLIDFPLLRPKNDHIGDFFVSGMTEMVGRTEEEDLTTLELAPERLDWTGVVRRGYCGWLMTNRNFPDEHCELLQTCSDDEAHHGTPNMGLVVRDAKAIP